MKGDNMKSETRLYVSNLMLALTGVSYMTTHGNNITLHYQNGRTETSKCKIVNSDDTMAIIKTVQSQRK